MRIEIWSDVVCPWCYIGKRRLESALAEFPHRDEVEVVYRSFELDPSAPQVGHESIREALANKYGMGEEQTQQMMERVSQTAAAEGLRFAYEDAMHTKTIDAHRLLHLAAENGLQAELKEALLAAYFTRGESMGDPDVLRKTAADVGLDPARVEEVLSGQEYAEAVQADIAQARAYGANGVPFFVVDQKYGVSGAQPKEVFAQLLDQAWADSHPVLTTVGDVGEADSCGIGGC
ncbi:MAG: DsbA family oxidoreductase [Nocardioidaceae bacterium]|nr:MAG: DsbA family oxidoreductase [Nocardioidaceae bacterium]